MTTRPIENQQSVGTKPAMPVTPEPPASASTEKSNKTSPDKGKTAGAVGAAARAVVYEGTSEDGRRPAKEGTLRAALEAIAKKFGKSSYDELPIADKLSALNEHLRTSGEGSPQVSEAIQQIQDVLREPPYPGQLDEIKKALAKLPKTEGTGGLQFEIQGQIKAGLTGYVVENSQDFGLDRNGMNNFVRDIKDTSVGQTPAPSFGFDEIANTTNDPPLKDFLNGEQAGIDLAQYSIDNVRDVNKLIELLDAVKSDIVNGARPDKGVYDPAEAKTVIGKIKKQIALLEEHKLQLEGVAQTPAPHGEDTFSPPKTARELIDKLQRERSFSYINTDAVTELYNDISDKEVFTAQIRAQIRKKIAILNAKSKPWSVGGSIDRDVQDLDTWLKILSGVDHEQWEKMHTETEARAWLFHMYDTLAKGASPMDTKELARPMQEFDKAEYWQSIARLPGVAKATMLLEERYDAILAAETNPTAHKKIFDSIIDAVKADPDFIKNADGMDAKSAVETANHFFHARLRDAQRYQMYMEKNNYIKIKHENGKISYDVDPNAPQLWNSFRLAIYPDAMWTFFQFGSSEGGVKRDITLKIRNSSGSYITKKMEQITTGQGVGAEVYEKLKDYGFSTNFTDFDSRRLSGYIIPAWIRERVQHEKDLIAEFSQLTPDKVSEWKEKHEDFSEADIAKWQKEHAEFEGGGDTAKLYAARKALEFCEKQKIFVPQGQLKELRGMKDNSAAKTLLTQIDSYNTSKGPVLENGSCAVLGDMTHYDISKVPYEWMLRLQEGFRGNYRDTFSALGVADVVGKFIVDPTLENFEKIDWHQMTGYTHPADAQQFLVLPAYLALRDMNRGKGPFGGELVFGLGKSKLGQVRFVPAMSDKELYEVGRWAVAKGGLSREMLYNARGRFLGLLKDKGLEYGDPISTTIIFLALVKELKEEVEKDSKGK